jgi:hypothetical protein
MVILEAARVLVSSSASLEHIEPMISKILPMKIGDGGKGPTYP